MAVKKNYKKKPNGKNNTGRPVAFKTATELEKAIKNYFDTITMSVPRTESVEIGVDDKGNPIYQNIPVLNNAGKQIVDTKYIERPSVMSMCVFLGITSETLGKYSEKDNKFSETITRAKEKILAFKLDALYWVKNPRGVMFDLNVNYNLVEKTAQDINHSGEIGTIVKVVDDI